MTNYTASARSTYVSLKVLLLAFGVPLGTCFYVSLLAFFLILAQDFDWRDALNKAPIPGAAAALGMWLYLLRKWWQTLQNIEAKSEPRQVEYPVTIYYKQPTDGGMITSPRQCPATYEQIRFVAQMAVRGESITNRSLRRKFTSDQASAYISWLVGEGHMAWRNENNHKDGAYVTDDGMAYFSQQAGLPLVKPHSYSPTGDGWVPFD